MKNKLVCITQARMTSSRLPGKILKEVNGKPLLTYHLERLKAIKGVDEIVVATTTNDTDECVAELAKQEGVTCFRGSEHDVLERYYLAAKAANADWVMRVTSDCPILDPSLHDRLITMFKNSDNLDGCSIDISSYCTGLDGEIVAMEGLAEVHANAVEQPDREHVTRYFHHNDYTWKVMPNTEQDLSGLRLCVDTEEDFARVKNVIEKLPEGPEGYKWQNAVKLAYG